MEEKDDDAVFHKEKPVIHKVSCLVCGAFYNCRNPELWDDVAEAGGFVCSFCGSSYQAVF